MAWLYVPEVEGWKPDFTLYSPENTAPFVLSNGKPMPLPASSPGWRKRPWARVLCGMTLPPSTLSHGVDLWISSLWACRVSPIHAPAKNLEKMTLVISGLTASGLYAKLSPGSSSGKMSEALLPMGDLHKSAPILKKQVTALRRESLARRKLALHIFAKDYFSSGNWPTPKASDGPKGGPNMRGSKGELALPSAVQRKNHFPTPAAAQSKQGRNQPDGRRGQTLLGAVQGQPSAIAHSIMQGAGLYPPESQELRSGRLSDTGSQELGNPDRAGFQRQRERRQPADRPISWPWPAGRDQEQYPGEEPRTVKSGMGGTINGLDTRAERIHMLGNGVLPVVAAMAFVALWERLNVSGAIARAGEGRL